jgi:hypothetical protein
MKESEAAFHAWVLADKYRMMSFQNSLVDAFRTKNSQRWFDVELLILLQEQNSSGDKLKDYLLDQIRYEIQYKPRRRIASR